MHNIKTEQDAEIRYQNRSSITQNHIHIVFKIFFKLLWKHHFASKFKNDSTRKLSLKVVRTFYSKYREGMVLYAKYCHLNAQLKVIYFLG